jgi:phage shock protein PspC (stress-responsive transcriptional regulator)
MRDWFRGNGLVRPRRGRVLGGICAAFAQRLGRNKWLVRLAAVLSIVIPGPQLFAYVLLWILMPEE